MTGLELIGKLTELGQEALASDVWIQKSGGDIHRPILFDYSDEAGGFILITVVTGGPHAPRQ